MREMPYSGIVFPPLEPTVPPHCPCPLSPPFNYFLKVKNQNYENQLQPLTLTSFSHHHIHRISAKLALSLPIITSLGPISILSLDLHSYLSRDSVKTSPIDHSLGSTFSSHQQTWSLFFRPPTYTKQSGTKTASTN